MAISLFTSVNTRLKLFSKKLWAMIHKTFTHVNELLLPVNEASKLILTVYATIFINMVNIASVFITGGWERQGVYKQNLLC